MSEIHGGHRTARSTVSRGPKCRQCRDDEARCAWLDGCCGDCTHWLKFTDTGEFRMEPAPGRSRLPVEHGTERGYHQHRTRLELPCLACKVAHSRYVGERKAS